MSKTGDTVVSTAEVKDTGSHPRVSSVCTRGRSDSKKSIHDSLKPKPPVELEKGAGQGILSRPWTRRPLFIYGTLAAFGVILLVLITALPILLTRENYNLGPAPYHYGGRPDAASYHIAENRPIYAIHDFPDPGLIHYNRTWYTYGTNPRKNNPHTIHVPVATSSNFVNWTLHEGYDALPTLGGWERRINHWAPDVIQRDDGRFILYYSGEVKHYHRHHCVGVAVSQGPDPIGPFIPEKKPFACPHKYGGAIDPSPFRDVDGKTYVTYKADGNSVGNGGYCGNSRRPLVSVPIMLQEVKSDGITKVGKPEIILDITKSDGPLVEAPSIIRTDNGTYFLFFSSHCFTSLHYNVKYAHAQSIRGPYVRAAHPLLETGDFGLKAPGGATVSLDGTKMVFHADCGGWRCMHVAGINIQPNHTIAMSALQSEESATSMGILQNRTTAK